jgi:hypothetical protein
MIAPLARLPAKIPTGINVNGDLTTLLAHYACAICSPSWTGAVANLLRTSRPSTIPRLIVAVIVYAVDLMLGRWLCAHISKEGFKRVSPAVANCDATPAISLPSVVIGIATALNHSIPGAKFG